MQSADGRYLMVYDGEIYNYAELAKRLRDGGLTMLMVEHELASVERVCDSVIVMAQGTLLATGTMSELRKNEEVLSAYLAG